MIEWRDVKKQLESDLEYTTEVICSRDISDHDRVYHIGMRDKIKTILSLESKAKEANYE